MVQTYPDQLPNFYDTDMQKWSEKFKNKIKERMRYKSMQSKTEEFNITTKNTNFLSKNFKMPFRKNSRYSTEAFNSIDFNYVGNTNDVRHINLNYR